VSHIKTGQHVNSVPVQMNNSVHPVSQSQNYNESQMYPHNDSTY
jgi:hypothetical protein